MRFSASAVFAVLSATAASAFVPSIHRHNAMTSRMETTAVKMSTVEQVEQNEKKVTKKEERLRFMKSDQFYRMGFKDVRKSVEGVMETQFKGKTVDELKSSNYVMQRDGVKVYLAKVRNSHIDRVGYWMLLS
jgi:4-hydroxy-3-methylbut-2-en-1-yl diphosphate reductase